MENFIKEVEELQGNGSISFIDMLNVILFKEPYCFHGGKKKLCEDLKISVPALHCWLNGKNPSTRLYMRVKALYIKLEM